MNHRTTLAAGWVALGIGLGAGTSARAGEADRVRVVIDADTANEVDDLFAIVRALVAPEFRVEGLNSAHWSYGTTEPNDTVRQSQRLNEAILDRMGLRDRIPHPLGADRPMPDASTPVDSPAARHIIARAHAGGPDDRLLVVALGAPTNLASALLLDPSIGPKVVFAYLDVDFKDGRWGPGLYNWVNDNHAVRALFAADVEFLVMPAPTVSGDLTLTRREVDRRFKGQGDVRELLAGRWESYEKSRDKDVWTMWDIALIQALLRPGLATRAVVGAPIIRDAKTVEQHPENPRRVTVFEAIDAEGMRRDFWSALESALDGDRAPDR